MALKQTRVRGAPASKQAKPLSRRLAAGGLAAVMAVAMAVTMQGIASADVIVPPDNSLDGAKWQLKYSEDFTTPLTTDDAPWVLDLNDGNGPWNVDDTDDQGDFFRKRGGSGFDRTLETFDLYRKRVEFGTDGWLTAEYAARDLNKDGTPDGILPSFSTITMPDGSKAGYMDQPRWDNALIVTSTNNLPSEYRIEYELKGLNYGGKRPDGAGGYTMAYDGRNNGYEAPAITGVACKNNFPWQRGGAYPTTGTVNPCASPYGNTTSDNGYYYLAIMDYAKPAPHNNIFIHQHRKVGMDLYAAQSSGYHTCNPATGDYYTQANNDPLNTNNNINALFFDGHHWQNTTMPYNEFLTKTPCGDRSSGINAMAEIQPWLMPDETYVFAIERYQRTYTMEVTGNFLHFGPATMRFTKPFEEEFPFDTATRGRPANRWDNRATDTTFIEAVNHYNNTPDEQERSHSYFRTIATAAASTGGVPYIYDGWPDGQSYPDNFIFGNPHINYYEGNATVANIKLYVPRVTEGDINVDLEIPEYLGGLGLEFSSNTMSLGTVGLSTDKAFWEGAGALPAIAIEDMRAADPSLGWDATITAGDWVIGPGNVDGKAFGIEPAVLSAAYGQTLTAGAPVEAWFEGFKTPGTDLASAAAGASRGLASVGGDVSFRVPSTVPAGSYSGVFSVTLL